MYSEIDTLGIMHLARSPLHFSYYLENHIQFNNQFDGLAIYLERDIKIPEIERLRQNKHFQVSPPFKWVDNGIKCVCQPHFYTKDIAVWFVRSDNASLCHFSLQMQVEKLYVLAAWLTRGIEIATGYKPMIVFSALEDYAPHAHGLYMVDLNTILEGQQEIYGLLEGYRKCCEDENWHSYSSRIEKISLPGKGSGVSTPLTSWI
ncbi:MAG: hypothetical protein IPP74_10080 [Alphaproteobacteria bacterium]|nr:hypothetical protein [Alphaproteobacteria bacterium]